MERWKQWKDLSPEEKGIRLNDIEVIFTEAKDLMKEVMIQKGFKPGTKIIDITYFTGLNEHGFTIASFLVQHEGVGEIRELTMNIDLKRMEITSNKNHFYSTGKERYDYLKRELPGNKL